MSPYLCFPPSAQKCSQTLCETKTESPTEYPEKTTSSVTPWIVIPEYAEQTVPQQGGLQKDQESGTDSQATGLQYQTSRQLQQEYKGDGITVTENESHTSESYMKPPLMLNLHSKKIAPQ